MTADERIEVVREALDYFGARIGFQLGRRDDLRVLASGREALTSLEARLAEAERRDNWLRTQLRNCIADLEALEPVVLDLSGWRGLVSDLNEALAALPSSGEAGVGA